MILTKLHGAAASGRPGTSSDDMRLAVDELRSLGFGAGEPGGGRDASHHRSMSQDERRLLGLLDRFDLELQLGRSLHGEAHVALIAWKGPGEQAEGNVFVGSAFSSRDAIRKCLGEMAEFLSWLCRPEDATCLHEKQNLTGDCIEFRTLSGFSDDQIDDRDRLNRIWNGYDCIPSPEEFAGSIHWSKAERLSDGGRVLLPTQICYGRYPAAVIGSQRSWNSDSNGCAAGPSFEQARMSALYELIERDAAGLWWYHGASKANIEWRTFADQALIHALRKRGPTTEPWFLDLTTDLGVPVVAAVATDRSDRLTGIGFGCHLDLESALRSAFLELCQVELALALTQQRAASTRGSRDDDLLRWAASATVDRYPQVTPMFRGPEHVERLTLPASADAFNTLITALKNDGIDVFQLDLTREDIEVPAVRLLAPGLCHYKPRFGAARWEISPPLSGIDPLRF